MQKTRKPKTPSGSPISKAQQPVADKPCLVDGFAAELDAIATLVRGVGERIEYFAGFNLAMRMQGDNLINEAAVISGLSKTLRGNQPNKQNDPAGAERRLSQLQKQVKERDALIETLTHECNLLALLAAETPQFFNPVTVAEAKKVRDTILSRRRANE